MKKFTRILPVILALCGLAIWGFADRGGITRKNKPQLNIEIHGTIKNSIPFNLKSGIVFRGSEILRTQKIGNSLVTESAVTYQKGKTLYILPYKQRIIIPQYSAKEGYKLVIRPK